MIGIRVTNRGSYKCVYCTHKSWKRQGPAEEHVLKFHEKEMLKQDAANLELELKIAQNKPPATKIVEKVVYKDKPEPPKPKFFPVGAVFCLGCQVVIRNCSIPRGQTIENTPHSECGNVMLRPVREIQ